MMELPVIPENAPFTAEQRLWLNGFVAGYFSRQGAPGRAATSSLAGPETAAVPRLHSNPLRIVFGSQTGTAQNLARRIAKEAGARGIEARVTDAAEHSKIDWPCEKHLFIVTSTYGDGDMPDNAQGFWDWLGTDAAKSLAHLQFAVLALGDRNYADFCGAGRKFDCRLEQLGARRIVPRIDCDIDYNAAAESWAGQALAAILKAGSYPDGTHESLTVAQVEGRATDFRNGHQPPAVLFSKAHPFPAPLARNLLLSKPGSAKEVRHYELSLEGSGLSYAPGDALGVVPINCPELVNDVLAAVHWSGDEPVSVGGANMPLRQAFARHLDITRPAPELLAAIAQRAPDSELGRLVASGQSAELKNWLWGRGVIDLLQDLPGRLGLEELTPLFKKLQPRLYSIASSPAAHPGEVHLTVSVLRYETYGRVRKGVASTFLADRAGETECVKVFVQPSPRFKPPADGGASMIMVGPGTGIAPFRSFLEERQATGATGRHWLFFGDQRRETDFLYEEQLTTWLAAGHLTRLDLAFSRDQAEKLYVQHRMLQHAAELWAWLEEGAHFYVCGDASRMAKDVEAALHQVAETAGGKSPDEAKNWVAKLKAEQRYQRDVY